MADKVVELVRLQAFDGSFPASDALSTLLGVGSDLALSGQGDLVQAIRQSTQDSTSRAGDQVTQRNLGVQPTITIRPGAPVRLVVHKDLVLVPTGGR